MWNTLNLLNARMIDLFRLVSREGEQVVLDGMPGFNDRAQFTNGKVIKLGAYVVANLLPAEEREEGITQLREMVRFTARMKMETWGMLSAIEGLWLLRERGLLEQSVDPETLDTLRRKLDWHDFVDVADDYALIHKPTNYYGVAFGIARYRELLGWDEAGESAILLEHLLRHISKYSGALGYMDETPGYGRFDRYSILIPAEITALVLATAWQEPELIRDMLGRSARIVLRMTTPEGTGFSYGRSIGAYGDTAPLSILSTAAALGGILSQEEEKLAFGYCRRLMETMVNFWYDPEMASINMWDKGRRTDGYRNKHRILGENISLSMQMVEAMEQWESRGYDWAQDPENWAQGLSSLPAAGLTLFSEDPLPRALLQVRQGKNVWSLPLIGGGPEYFDRDPYLPVPRCNGVLEAVPDVTRGGWVPCLRLREGGLLIPAGRAERIQMEPAGDGCVLRYHQSGALTVGGVPGEYAAGMEVDTVYTFTPGAILREDTLRLTKELAEQAEALVLTCDLLRGQVETSGYETETRTTWAEAQARGICLDTPHGPCREQRVFTLPHPAAGTELRVSWRFQWREEA